MTAFYLYGCVILGLVCLFDGFVLWRAQGHLAKAKITLLTSTIEFCWAVYSIFQLYTASLTREQVLLPVLFITYSVFGWLYSFKLAQQHNTEHVETLDAAMDIIIPRWFVIFSLSFGGVFTALSLSHFVR